MLSGLFGSSEILWEWALAAFLASSAYLAGSNGLGAWAKGFSRHSRSEAPASGAAAP